MQRAKINIKINDYIIKETGIIDNDILKLKDKEDSISFDLKNLVLTKENKELKIVMDFKNKQVIYHLIKENQKFTNNFTVFSLTNRDKQVIINYQIEDADFNMQINYETI